LLILGGVYSVVCLSSSLNIGHRHMMPIYPVLFVLAGANVFWLRSARPLLQMGLVILLCVTMIESLAVRPHYLAFFNQFMGGPRNGYRYLINSSLDWGQDLPGLKAWLEKNVSVGDNTKVYFSYCGTGSSEFYGIACQRLPDRFGFIPSEDIAYRGGLYCISATNLYGAPWIPAYEKEYRDVTAEINRWNATRNDPGKREGLIREKGQEFWRACLQELKQFQFYRLCDFVLQRKPDDEVGYSILIYRLSDEEVRQALQSK
jgi:hypothetical protein